MQIVLSKSFSEVFYGQFKLMIWNLYLQGFMIERYYLWQPEKNGKQTPIINILRFWNIKQTRSENLQYFDDFIWSSPIIRTSRKRDISYTHAKKPS